MNKLHLANILIFSFVFLCFCSCGSNQTENSNEQSKPAVASGADIYKQTCITCHQANGEGIPNTYPPLAKSDFLSDKEKTIGQVIKGHSGEIIVNGKSYNNIMPPQQLSDEEIASVLTFVYGNFGNSGGTITPQDVKATRAKL